MEVVGELEEEEVGDEGREGVGGKERQAPSRLSLTIMSNYSISHQGP